jgi:hypothetical protein
LRWLVGLLQAVDEEWTWQTSTPMEDGHEMPFFLTRGVKGVIPNGDSVWCWESVAATATKVAFMVMVLSSIFMM